MAAWLLVLICFILRTALLAAVISHLNVVLFILTVNIDLSMENRLLLYSIDFEIKAMRDMV